MTRKSGRLSSAGSAVKHKRSTSGSSTIQANVKRSKKIEALPDTDSSMADAGEAEDKVADEEEEDLSSEGEATVSEFGGDDDASESDLSDHAESEDDENESDTGLVRRNNTSKSNGGRKPGIKAGLGPGKQIIIKKPKARPAGATPYTDETVHPNTMLFLKELKENNNRDWLKLHDAEYRQAEKDWHTFVEQMTEKLAEIDDTIPELPVKDVIFRIYRDVRFSKDPTPYKPWFSVAWSRAGRKGSYAHYYVQYAPNKSFVGGGLWQPEASATQAMRTAIDRFPRALKDVLRDEHIRKEYLDGAKKDDAAVKAFVKANSGNALKTKPKGYDGDHPDISLLRLRNYTIGKSLTDEEVLGKAGTQRVAELLACLKPFITYLNSVVMPDDDQDDSADEEDEDDGQEESDA